MTKRKAYENPQDLVNVNQRIEEARKHFIGQTLDPKWNNPDNIEMHLKDEVVNETIIGNNCQ
jgi:hypothetical protein